jgi:hypothetical protein
MESTENDRTVFRPSHKTLKIEKTDFHIPTATTTTEQSFHLKTRKTGPDNRSHLREIPSSISEFVFIACSFNFQINTVPPERGQALTDRLLAASDLNNVQISGL